MAALLAEVRSGNHAQLERQARALLLRYPAVGFLWKALGVALWAQRKDSLQPMEQAAALLPLDAEAHINLANAYRACGRRRDAVSSYHRALELRPEDADTHDRLGSALFELGDIDAAADSCRRATALRPQAAEWHCNLAMLLLLQNRAAEAAECCRRALELDPTLTGALVILAELEAADGAFDRAEELLRRAIAIEPDMPEAWAALGRWRRSSRADEAWLGEVQRMLRRQIPPRREIPLRYALGKYFDDLGQFEEAFTHYHRANELAKLHNPAYDRLEVTRQVDLLVGTCDRHWLTRAEGKGDPSERPVFIVGMWRSGTTLAEQILASHPAVGGVGEVSFWNAAAARSRLAAPLVTLAGEYLQLLDRLCPEATRVADKMSANFLHLGLIHACLPNARIIHLRRDPMDTCLSIYFQDFAHGHPYANDLGDIAHYYREYRRLMDHWRCTLPPQAMLEVAYEDLVDDQERSSRRMLDFVGVPWDPRCLEFHRGHRTVMTTSKWQVRQPMNRSSLQRWRNYARHIAPLMPLAELR
jgi:tetratricopeptide (TPR) repeat protein